MADSMVRPLSQHTTTLRLINRHVSHGLVKNSAATSDVSSVSRGWSCCIALFLWRMLTEVGKLFCKLSIIDIAWHVI